MEIIAVILMIVFALISAGDRKKKAANRAGNAQAGARPQAKARSVGQMSLSEREARLNELRQKRAERLAQKAEASDDFFPMAPGSTQASDDFFPVMPSNAQAAFDSSLTELKELLNVAQAQGAEGGSMLDDPECVGGSMPHTHAEGGSVLEDEECAGGSMAHSHTQGVSRAAQKRRLSNLDRNREAEATEGLIPRAIDAQAMRRAVVMAEVLGRPKGLRGARQ